MKIFVPNLNKEGTGGGNTFVANFRKHTIHELISTIEGAEVMFVPNPMWAERADFEAAKDRKIKIVLRLDNIPEDWNNRGTAISKLKDFISWSGVIVYQSRWAEAKYQEFMKANVLGYNQIASTVILNGVDTDLFSPSGDNISFTENPVILYVKSSRNENKRYPEAMEIFRRYYAHNPNAKLLLVGSFADDIRTYNFGFYNGENYQYLGPLSFDQMPMVYRSADILLFPAYADCAPNVVLEAMSCGVVPIINSYGGAEEFLGINYEAGGYDNGVSLEYLDSRNYPRLIERAQIYDRQSIREHVVKNFDIKNVVKQYEEVICGQ